MKPQPSLPRLLRFMLKHFGNGAVLGLVLGEGLLWWDVLGLRQLVVLAEAGAFLTAAFFAYAAMLFGTVAMCVAVMNLGERD
ncbi:hypothetical protein [Tabrizicola aquatica]|uniref:hypothetical protein n=1 Tax=Tabrizicola aquatica TaxID=909926 RepID=UPI000CD29070|nr:hypothetical protein [Tabrizicola aquatica]